MSLVGVQIAPAKGTAAHANEGLAFAKLRKAKLFDREGLAGPGEQCGFRGV